MPDDGPLLLQAILANPEEDAPRAAFADWLQDQPDEFNQWYGRFIAEQLAGEYPRDDVMYRDTVLGKASLAIKDYGLRVRLPGNDYATSVTYWGDHTRSDSAPIFDVNRGFVCGAELTCSDFLKIAGPLFARHPVDRVELIDRRCGGPIYNENPSHQYWECGKTDEYCFWHVPQPIFDHLDGETRRSQRGSHPFAGDGRQLTYTTAALALAALRRACLAFGKRAAADWLLTNTP